jgi:hypothetical protein
MPVSMAATNTPAIVKIGCLGIDIPTKSMISGGIIYLTKLMLPGQALGFCLLRYIVVPPLLLKCQGFFPLINKLLRFFFNHKEMDAM